MVKPNPSWRGDPTFLPEVLRAFGVTVVEMDGWLNRGHGDFGAIQGIIVHHIGVNKSDPSNIAFHPSLGLASQIHLSRSGVATLCGVGIAWHAGRGSYNRWPTNNANVVSIGIEAESDGVTPWPAEQMAAYYRVCAAILWFLGKPATTDHLIAHWEYSRAAQGKWDPGAGNGIFGAVLDMNHFRSEVQKLIDNPPFRRGSGDGAGKENEVAFTDIATLFASRVAGSNYKGRPIDFLLNADAHAFVSRANTEEILKRLDAIDKRLSAIEGGN